LQLFYKLSINRNTDFLLDLHLKNIVLAEVYSEFVTAADGLRFFDLQLKKFNANKKKPSKLNNLYI